MRGLWIESGAVRFRDDLPAPGLPSGGTTSTKRESRVRVRSAGVCATDLALARGYMSFVGVPGHEFVGEALDGPHAGRRVVGEINASCGKCPTCRAGNGRHCAERTVLGILGRSGAFAEELTLPTENLHVVPETLADEAAVFAEPLAAALRITEQLRVRELAGDGRALVLGDGRLGLLCAAALALGGLGVDLAGRHPERAEMLPALLPGHAAPPIHRGDLLAAEAPPAGERWPLVVEATGDPRVLQRAQAFVRPLGTLVLKTTCEAPAPLDLAPLVVDEITLVGSRCGPFEPALAALASGAVDPAPLLAARYSLAEGAEALGHAGRPGVLKVLLEVG